MEAKSGSGKVSMEPVTDGAKIAENQPAPRSAEPAVNASDVPAPAPSQLNESASSSTDQAAANTSSSTDPAKDDPKNASSSRKVKKKHHFHIPIPF